MIKKIIFGIAFAALTSQAMAASEPYKPKVNANMCITFNGKSIVYLTNYKDCMEPVQRGYAKGVGVGVWLKNTATGKVSAGPNGLVTPTQGYSSAPAGYIVDGFNPSSAYWAQ